MRLLNVICRGRVTRVATFLFIAACIAPLSFAQEHVINLKDADIRAFIEDTSVVTGKTFIVDPRVTGTVSVSSQAKLTQNEVFQVFQDVLRVRGFTALPTSHGAYRITLIQGAAQAAPFASSQYGGFTTEILKLAHGDAAEAVKLVKPVMHSQGRITANPGGRVMVITDYPENIKKVRHVIDAIAVDPAAIITIPLQHISATDARETVDALEGNGQGGAQNRAGGGVTAVAVEAINSLILRGDPAKIDQLRKMILDLDASGSAPPGQVGVIPLRYANAEDVVTVLENILPTFSRELKAGDMEPTVAFDAASNTILVSAKPEIQSSLENVVRRLDIRRPQVLVEAIIVEISDTTAEDLGVQFILAGNEGSALPVISTNYSRSAPNLLAITGALVNDSRLDTVSQGNLREAAITSLLGLQGGTFGIGGSGSDGLFGAVLNAVQNDTDSNVLSTPFVTTLDNVPATFLVGQEVPFTSGATLGANNTNPFRAINREDVGIKLEVLPQINEGDVVRLEIRQEVSSIAPDVSTMASDLVTNKREISTTVLAENGEIIVLGGLIQDNEQLFQGKTPVLGDVPVIGNLFKGKSNERTRTNLMVFIRPTIIRDGAAARPLTQRKLDIIRAEEYQKNPERPSRINQMLDRMQFETPVAPSVTQNRVDQ